MGIVFRQSVKTTIVTGFGAILGASITIIYTYLLTLRDLGFINYVVAVCAILQMLVQLGTGHLLQVFIQKYDVGDERRKVLFTYCLCVPVIVIAILCVPFYLFEPQIVSHYELADRPNIIKFYKLIPITVFLWTYMTMFELFFISRSRAALSTFMRDVLLRICNIVLIVLYFFKVIGFTCFVTGLLLMYGIPAIILFGITLTSEGSIFAFNKQAFDKAEYKEMIHYAWYHALLLASLFLIGNIDLLMLGVKDKTGMASVAAYKIALYLISLMLIPYTAMAAATWPMINKAYLNKDADELKSVFTRSAINVLLITLGTAAVLFCNLSNILNFVAKGKGYEKLIPIFSILMIGRIIDIATGLNNEVISISRFYKFSFRVSILLIVLVFIFDYMLIPQYSVYGAAWGTTLAFAVFNILKAVFLWKKLRIQPFSKHTLGLFLSIAPAVAAGYFMPFVVNTYIDLMVRSMVVVVIYAGMLLWLRPSPDMMTYLNSVKTNKRLF